ncbi:MAG: hypothetical protein Q9M91_00525 [Candidatus Dojkabacteria bacterium]|nr:hypothetical protein [Candidatus Dojkabacteria bacterium]MDQ7020314.1 hypothetical protein [Candidatus Dojkabacteria bacterium]
MDEFTDNQTGHKVIVGESLLTDTGKPIYPDLYMMNRRGCLALGTGAAIGGLATYLSLGGAKVEASDGIEVIAVADSHPSIDPFGEFKEVKITGPYPRTFNEGLVVNPDGSLGVFEIKPGVEAFCFFVNEIEQISQLFLNQGQHILYEYSGFSQIMTLPYPQSYTYVPSNWSQMNGENDVPTLFVPKNFSKTRYYGAEESTLVGSVPVYENADFPGVGISNLTSNYSPEDQRQDFAGSMNLSINEYHINIDLLNRVLIFNNLDGFTESEYNSLLLNLESPYYIANDYSESISAVSKFINVIHLTNSTELGEIIRSNINISLFLNSEGERLVVDRERMGMFFSGGSIIIDERLEFVDGTTLRIVNELINRLDRQFNKGDATSFTQIDIVRSEKTFNPNNSEHIAHLNRQIFRYNSSEWPQWLVDYVADLGISQEDARFAAGEMPGTWNIKVQTKSGRKFMATTYDGPQTLGMVYNKLIYYIQDYLGEEISFIQLEDGNRGLSESYIHGQGYGVGLHYTGGYSADPNYRTSLEDRVGLYDRQFEKVVPTLIVSRQMVWGMKIQ